MKNNNIFDKFEENSFEIIEGIKQKSKEKYLNEISVQKEEKKRLMRKQVYEENYYIDESQNNELLIKKNVNISFDEVIDELV